MIKYCIHLADLHIKNDVNESHMKEKMTNLVKQLADTIKPYKKDEVRIVIVGDIYESKIRISNEARSLFHSLLNALDKMATTYIVAGNHDMLQGNKDRLDSLSPTFKIKNAYKNVFFIDSLLNYKSGYVEDENVIFALFSMFDDFKDPNINGLKQKYPDKRIVALYHGDSVGSVTDIGYMSDSGIDSSLFKECDCVMAGHIHKFQEIRNNGVPLVYSGSVFQKDFGENTTGHGFVVWNLETMEYRLVEVENDYKYYKFEIEDYDDVKNDTERLLNQ